jgi:ABC-type uncharacterized transport system YnjBCD ATPase subunit
MPMENRVGRREKERFVVNVMGTVRTGSGKPIQAEITDLSENGCAFTVGTVWMQNSDHASLRVNDRQVGIEFHRPVYGSVFEHLRALIATADKQRDRRHGAIDIASLARSEAQRRVVT